MSEKVFSVRLTNSTLMRFGPAVLLVVLTLILYVQVAGFRLQYSWDDQHYVWDNPLNPTFPATAVTMFSDPYFGARIPITLVVYGIEYRLFGTDNQGAYFLVNMLLHALNAILVYRFLFRLTGNRMVGLLAAVLFVVHPVNVESVAWVSQLKTTLSLMFFLLSWLTHMEANDRQNGTAYLVLSWVWFALAIFSKQTAVGGVILFVIYDYWSGHERDLTKLLLRNLPYAIIGVLGAVSIITSHQALNGIKAPWGGNFAEDIALQLRVTADYVGSLLLPFNLNNMYIYTPPDVLGSVVILFLGFLFLVGMVVFAIWQPLGKPFCAFAVAWVVVTILPTSNIIPIAIQRADRYLYYPSILIFMLIAMAWMMLWERFQAPAQRYLMIAVGTGYVAVLCVLTFGRVGVWQSTETLWSDHLQDYPNSETGLLNLSVGYYFDNQLQDAVVTLQRLVQINPDHYKGNRLLGLSYLRANQYPSAIITLEKAMSLGGTNADFRDQLGIAYFQEGLRQFELGELANTLALYSRALNFVSPQLLPVVMNNIGYTLQRAGRMTEAIEALDAAIQLQPDYALAYVNRGEAYLFQEDYTQARDNYQQAIDLGAQLDAKASSSMCLAKGELQDDVNQTLTYCQTSLQLDPNNAVFLGRTAHVLLLYNQNDAAFDAAQRSLQQQPTSLGYRTLADVLVRRGDTAGAIEAYRQALTLDAANKKALAGLSALGATP